MYYFAYKTNNRHVMYVSFINCYNRYTQNTDIILCCIFAPHFRLHLRGHKKWYTQRNGRHNCDCRRMAIAEKSCFEASWRPVVKTSHFHLDSHMFKNDLLYSSHIVVVAGQTHGPDRSADIELDPCVTHKVTQDN